MIVSENPAAAAELIRRANDHQKALYPREEGLHVSDLIYCRRKAWYRRQARAQGAELEEYDTDTLAMFLLGHGYHALLEQGVDERKVVLTLFGSPGQGGLQVHGTVDHTEDNGFELYPHEFKTTRASSSKAIEMVQHYIEQVAAYALGMNTERGQLSVIYINGSYNKGGSGMKPTIKTFDLEFTRDELREWREELTRRAFALVDTAPPALPCHRTWECGYCPFNQKVGGPCPAGKGDERHWFMKDDPIPGFLDDVLTTSSPTPLPAELEGIF